MRDEDLFPPLLVPKLWLYREDVGGHEVTIPFVPSGPSPSYLEAASLTSLPVYSNRPSPNPTTFPLNSIRHQNVTIRAKNK